MKKLLFITVAVGLLAVSCKNRNAARTLEGTWYETKINGVDVPSGSQDQIIFGKCNGGENKECDLTLKDCCSGDSFNYNYTVIDGGETLVLKISAGIAAVATNHKIQSLTENELVVEWNFSNGDYIGTYSK